MRHQQGLLSSYYGTRPLFQADFDEYFPENHNDPDMPDVSELSNYLDSRHPFNGSGCLSPPEDGESGYFKYGSCVIVKIGIHWVNGVVVRKVRGSATRAPRYLVYVEYDEIWYKGIFAPSDGTIITDSPMTRYCLRAAGYTRVCPPK